MRASTGSPKSLSCDSCLIRGEVGFLFRQYLYDSSISGLTRSRSRWLIARL